MSSVESQKRYTVEEYLSHEKESVDKHEFYAGEIVAVLEGSLDHGAIAFNWCGELKAALKGKNCRAFTSDVKVRIETEDAFVYPDVFQIPKDSLSPGVRHNFAELTGR